MTRAEAKKTFAGVTSGLIVKVALSGLVVSFGCTWILNSPFEPGSTFAVKSPLELLRGRPDLAAAEARAGIDGARAALLALPIRVRAGIPRGAEPR